MDTLDNIDNDSFSLWKNIILISLFFVVTPITLGASLFSLMSLSHTSEVEAEIVEKQVPTVLGISDSSGAKVFASLPATPPSVSSSVVSADARPVLIRQYLERYNSPLVGKEGVLVAASDQNDLDYRLLTAIAQQESNLCKIIPPNTYNCWGWGIHSKGTLGFDSYEEAMFTVAKGLKQEYIDKGYRTPEEIMSKYTPLSNGSWAYGVTQFMSELE